MLIGSDVAKSFFGLTLMLAFVRESALLESMVLALTFFFGAYNFSAISVVETESFPLKLQSTAIGIIFTISEMTRVFIPYLIGFMNEH